MDPQGEARCPQLLVVKDGKLIFERYSGGLTRQQNYELYSITKGITSLAAGVLISEGRASLPDDEVSTVLTQWRPALQGDLADKQDITTSCPLNVHGSSLQFQATKRSHLLRGT